MKFGQVSWRVWSFINWHNNRQGDITEYYKYYNKAAEVTKILEFVPPNVSADFLYYNRYRID